MSYQILVLWTRVAEKPSVLFWTAFADALEAEGPHSVNLNEVVLARTPVSSNKLNGRLKRLLFKIYLWANNHLLATVSDKSLLLAFFIKEFGLSILISLWKMEKWQGRKEGGRGRRELISVKESLDRKRCVGGGGRREEDAGGLWRGKGFGGREDYGLFLGRLFYSFES